MPGVSAFPLGGKASQLTDPWTYLLERKRIVYLTSAIYEGVPANLAGIPALVGSAAPVVADLLLALDAVNHEPIKLFIDSPGGGIEAGLTIYDTMQSIRSPVYTIGRGTCASMAAVLLAAGAAGHRYAFPNCAMMLHLARGESQGTRQERERREKVLQQYEQRVAALIIKHCRKQDQDVEHVLSEWREESELWMFPHAAVTYGLVDKIITPEIFSQEIFPET